MKTFILENFKFVHAYQKAAFYRKHFEETSAVSDEHYEFPSGRPHGGKFKNGFSLLSIPIWSMVRLVFTYAKWSINLL